MGSHAGHPQCHLRIPDRRVGTTTTARSIVRLLTKASKHDPSKAFHKKVNKRLVPGYYDIITEPIALSTIKAKLQTKAYHDFRAFVRDFALVC